MCGIFLTQSMHCLSESVLFCFFWCALEKGGKFTKLELSYKNNTKFVILPPFLGGANRHGKNVVRVVFF